MLALKSTKLILTTICLLTFGSANVFESNPKIPVPRVKAKIGYATYKMLKTEKTQTLSTSVAASTAAGMGAGVAIVSAAKEGATIGALVGGGLIGAVAGAAVGAL